MSLSQSFSQKIGNVRPLNPCPSLDIDFANGGYVNTGGFANQESVGSANFKIGAFNGPDPIFARSSAATFRGSNGLIQYAPENLLQYSEQFDNSSVWATTGVSVDPNQIASPSGVVSADKLTTSGTAATQRISYNTAQIGLSCFSVYVKAGTASFVQLLHGSSSNVYANFNVSTGSVGNVGALTTASIQSVGSGWYRCVVSTAAITTGSSWHIYIVQSNTAAYGAAFSATVANLYIWGAQLERSSTARPYISTTSAARYGPRFEYDLNGNPLGLLMEEQSQNLVQYSEQFDNAYWDKTTAFVTLAANSSVAPNGLLAGDRISETVDNTPHILFSTSPNPSIVSGSVYSSSIFCKKGNGSTAPNWIQVAPRASGFGNGEYANFNISSGTIGSYSGSIPPKIEYAGNGWWRCTMFATATATTSSNTGFAIGFNNNSGSSTRYPAYVGATTSDVFIWGAQLEQKPFATSYIPTVGGTSTRNADVVSSTISSWFNQTEGTVVVSGDRNNNPTLNSSGLDSFFEFTGTASYLLVHACDGTTEAVYDAAGSPATTVGVTIGSLTSIAASYSDVTDLLHISRNGLATQSGPSTGLGVAPTTLNIGYAPVSLIGYWNGHIKSFRYFPKALPNNLQRLSS